MKCNRNQPFFQSQNQTPKEKMKVNTDSLFPLTGLHCVSSSVCSVSRTSRNPPFPPIQQWRGYSVTKVSQIMPVPKTNLPIRTVISLKITTTQSRAIKRNRVLSWFILYLQFVVFNIYLYIYTHQINQLYNYTPEWEDTQEVQSVWLDWKNYSFCFLFAHKPPN